MAPQRPDAIAFLTGALSTRAYPGGIALPGQGGKFDTGGSVEIWPGNTFVSHLDRRAESYQAVLALQEEVKRSSFARFFTFLPAPSFHMTVFQGYSPGRERDAFWPADLSLDHGLDAMTDRVAQKVQSLELDPFEIKPTGFFCAKSLTIEGATEADEVNLRQARRQLRDATGVTPPGFDSYVFHVTLAYLVQWLSPACARELVDFSNELETRFCRDVPRIALEPCAFCSFESMHHFEPVTVLPFRA